jgi:hypothetical protein
MADVIAAAEKGAAEKAAAEKAAAEKAAAEKAAAEKAAAEKAAAEKAAAEKAAAEKAAAEKAAAEKAAAEAEAPKQQAPAPDAVSVSYEPPPDTPPLPAEDRAARWMILGGIGAAALLLALLIGFSMSNTGRYYLRVDDGSLEIWQGRFAPMGTTKILILPGVAAPETIAPEYSRQEVFPLAFQYYIDQADALLTGTAIPDFEQIKSLLQQASAYAVTPELKQIAAMRLTTIDFVLLIYKSDAAASRGGPADLEAAMRYLDEAALLDLDDTQFAMLDAKTAFIKERMAEVERQAVAAPPTAEAH